MTAARLDRAQVLSFIDAAAPDSPVVLSLGGIAREMLAVAGRKGNHFVSLDAMGQTISVALGIALGLENSDRTGKVLVVEGDGSLLMGLSVLSTVGHLKPRRLLFRAAHEHARDAGRSSVTTFLAGCARLLLTLRNGWSYALRQMNYQFI
jgi:Thiamine pyrophosphate enzyme, C-terminal TPP binding domain